MQVNTFPIKIIYSDDHYKSNTEMDAVAEISNCRTSFRVHSFSRHGRMLNMEELTIKKVLKNNEEVWVHTDSEYSSSLSLSIGKSIEQLNIA